MFTDAQKMSEVWIGRDLSDVQLEKAVFGFSKKEQPVISCNQIYIPKIHGSRSRQVTNVKVTSEGQRTG